MISKETIQTIFETVRVDEIISEFVSLKKRGVNFIGLCPFHNEKTPSFTVSPTKGIYKCFGCGKAGNAVNFLMEHEHYTYPEALKYIAKKYNIEIDEEEQSPEQIQSLNEKESLYHVSVFAQNYFSDNLLNNEEGKAIGLTYFKERGFTTETIEKFQLGYCIDKWDDFTSHAQKNAYKLTYLTQSGLTISKDNKTYDRFRGRVMFPIHNLSGRVIGFGGRILSAEASKAKYVNSPESEIYSKSRVLYGIYYAKNSIIKNDNCYLVEGYTDVISLNQSGVENVVASSGTSLTTEQIKLIKRFTKNVTILYDGDLAGIKASFRGIDMILEEGMNVKIVMFPDGEDPDSYARDHSSEELGKFINKTAANFIIFKTNLLLEEAENDPIKKATLIKEIVNSIAIIPDIISRSVYIKECGTILNIKEQTLMNELNKILRKKFYDKNKFATKEEFPEATEYVADKQIFIENTTTEIHEKNLIRLLLNFGKQEITIKEKQTKKEDNKKEPEKRNIAELIVNEIKADEMKFNNFSYQAIFDEFANIIIDNSFPDEMIFINHADEKIRKIASDMIISPYTLSKNWKEKYDILVLTEEMQNILSQEVITSVFAFKSNFVDEEITKKQKELKSTKNSDDIKILMQEIKKLKNVSNLINKKLGRVVTK